MSGMTSLATNSSAVWPIRRWSSVSSAGVKTSSGRGDSMRKLPPFAAVLMRVAVAILVAPRRDRCNQDSVNVCFETGHADRSKSFPRRTQ